MVASRIKEQLKLHHMKMNELCELSGVSEATLHNIMVGKSKDPRASTLMAIAKVFQVSVNYLLGEGFISDDEKDLLQDYRDCGPHGKSVLRLAGKYEALMAKTEREGKVHKVPCLKPLGHITDGIQCGDTEMDEVETNIEKAFFAIEIVTNNVLPSYCKGDKILLEDRVPENGERAIFVMDNYIYLRQIFERENGYLLKPVGRTGEATFVRRLDGIQCMGTCIGVIRK